MTRRERLERKVEKREQWADSRTASAARNFDRADLSEAKSGIPLGQPVLVGHHSERRHRKALERADAAMGRAVEDSKMAAHHRSAGAGLAAALERSIFSDDPDALEALTEKIEHLEAKRAACAAVNKAWRKAKKPKADDEGGWRFVAAELGCTLEELAGARRNARSEEGFLHRGPYPAYVLSNLGGNITRCKKRLQVVKLRQERTARVEAAGGFLIERSTDGEYCSVTFEEFPGREIVNELKAAAFYWGGGSWSGRTEKLPASVLAMEAKDDAQLAGTSTILAALVNASESLGDDPIEAAEEQLAEEIAADEPTVYPFEPEPDPIERPDVVRLATERLEAGN